MNAAWQFEDSALDQAITALCIVPIQFGIGVVWAVWQVVKFAFAMFVWLFTAASESRQQVAMLAAIIGATLIVVSAWQIGVGVAVVAALTVVAKRKGKI